MTRRSFFAMLTGGLALPFVKPPQSFTYPETFNVTYRAGHSMEASRLIEETVSKVLEKERQKFTRQLVRTLTWEQAKQDIRKSSKVLVRLDKWKLEHPELRNR